MAKEKKINKMIGMKVDLSALFGMEVELYALFGMKVICLACVLSARRQSCIGYNSIQQLAVLAKGCEL